MKPYAVKRLAGSFPHTDIALARFLLRWMAWEALQHRTLVVMAHKQGWSIADAEIVVDELSMSSMKRFRKILAMLEGDPSIDENVWSFLERIERVRNKLVHGVFTPNPAHLDVFSAFLEAVVTSNEAVFARRVRHKKPLAIDDLRKKLKARRHEVVDAAAVRQLADEIGNTAQKA